MFENRTTTAIEFPSDQTKDLLTPVLREGAKRMLAMAIEIEAQEWLDQRSALLDVEGHRLVVRNGRQPIRTVQTGVGDIEVAKPRVHDRRKGPDREVFQSRILPPYLRRTKAIEELIPWMYLKGISTGGFAEALQSLLGPEAAGLSSTTVTRLIQGWQAEHAEWSRRSLADRYYVYVWADGIHFNIRLEDEANRKQCILVLMGATADGQKELIAVIDGFRESEQSWLELIQDVKRRGMTIDPKLAIADGALGFWAAMRKAWPSTREQRCWVHKTANVLNRLPRSMQPKAKDRLHEIWMAATRIDAEKAFDAFIDDFSVKYADATDCLVKDRDVLLAFYDFPAEHWRHLRTTNPIESTFATVRLRTAKTRNCLSRNTLLAMVFKLCQAAEKNWRRLHGYKLIADVIRDVRFVDGVREDRIAA